LSLPQFTPSNRARVARVAALVSIIAWPLTQFTVARTEPPFTLGLSWLAIILTFADLAATTDVREHAEPEGDNDG
jgi:hypothetical protein